MPVTIAISELHNAYDKGMFYCDGAWVDQPAWYTDAMRLYDGEINALTAERSKRHD